MKLLRHLKPTKEFTEDTKIVFLHAFKEKFPRAAHSPVGVFLYFVRGMATGLALMIILGGASVYADQKNVGPENILYPLKRSQELLSLVLTNKEERPELHLKFAERRLHEVSEIRKNNPENPKIQNLVKDLRDEVKNSFAAIGNGSDEATNETESDVKPKIKTKDSSKKSEGIEFSLEAPAPAATPSASSGKFRDENEGENEGNKKRDLGKKTLRQNQKIIPICHSFKGIIEDGGEDIRELIEEHPEFLEKFKRKCLPLVEED